MLLNLRDYLYQQQDAIYEQKLLRASSNGHGHAAPAAPPQKVVRI